MELAHLNFKEEEKRGLSYLDSNFMSFRDCRYNYKAQKLNLKKDIEPPKDNPDEDIDKINEEAEQN